MITIESKQKNQVIVNGKLLVRNSKGIWESDCPLTAQEYKAFSDYANALRVNEIDRRIGEINKRLDELKKRKWLADDAGAIKQIYLNELTKLNQAKQNYEKGI